MCTYHRTEKKDPEGGRSVTVHLSKINFTFSNCVCLVHHLIFQLEHLRQDVGSGHIRWFI